MAPPTFDVATALSRLTELGPPSELRSRAPAEAARTLRLERVILSSLAAGALHVEAVHPSDDEAQAAGLFALPDARTVSIEYPLIESEIVRRRRPRIVRAAEQLAPTRQALGDVLAGGDYLIVPVLLDGRVVGFLHADRAPAGRPLDEDDAASGELFAMCFALVFERAALRQRLRTQQRELRQVASWAQARTTDVSDRLVSLTEDAGASAGPPTGRPPGGEDGRLRDLLTRREIEVLELMVRGETNPAIARELVLSAGTVKFHVQNILRKLRVNNRAEATSRYLRLTLTAGDEHRHGRP